MTDVDSVEFNFDTEDSVTGTAGSSDNITYNISNLENTGGYMYLDSNGMESITVNVNGDSVIEDIDDTSIQGDLQTLDIVANADLTSVNIYLNDSTSTEITVIGTGNVDLGDVSVGDGDAIDTVTVDASALTGDFTMIDNDGNINTIESGTGDDNITVAAFTTEVTTNDGDDTVDTAGLDFGHADAETVDGGDGNDTVAIIDATLADAEYMANVVNFETLEIAGATAIGIAGTATAYDMDVMGFTDVKLTNTAIAANTVIENVAAGALFTMTNTDNITPLTAGGILTYSLEDASAADDEVALVMHTVDTAKTADNVAIAASTSAAIIIEQDADSEGVETIALTSNATTASVADDDNDAWTSSDYTNSLSLDAADMTDLVIDGNAQAAVIFTDATALTFVDASGNEAGVAVDASAGGIVAGVTFKGSEAADTYTATANGDLVQANGGADDILLGAGDDTVRYAVASDSQLTLKDTSDPADEVADVASGYDSIAGFNAVGTDLIELSSLLNLATGDARADMLQKGEITTAAVDGTWTPAEIEAFIGDGVDFFDTGVVDRATAFAFTDDVDETLPALGTTGQGFLFVDANNDGNFTQADDMVIALSGVESLLITDITFG